MSSSKAATRAIATALNATRAGRRMPSSSVRVSPATSIHTAMRAPTTAGANASSTSGFARLTASPNARTGSRSQEPCG
ncbi:hypothetical protein ACFPRL_24855 [Pseudoclavibacter helvolus]